MAMMVLIGDWLVRLIFFFLVAVFRFFICVGVLVELSVHSLNSVIVVFVLLKIRIFSVSVGFGTATVICLVLLEVVVAEGLKQLKPIGKMVSITLGDGLARNVVEIELDDGGNLFDDFLYFLASG